MSGREPGGKSGLTRRAALQLAGGLAGAAGLSTALPPLAAGGAWAAGRSGLHGLSIFGELNYLEIRNQIEGAAVHVRSLGFSVGFPLARFF